jgi:hypothetical protein
MGNIYVLSFLLKNAVLLWKKIFIFEGRIIMCKISIYLISLALILAMVDYAFAQDADIPATPTPPVIDGIKDTCWWASTEYLCLNTVAGEPPDSSADLSASWRAMWDAEYLYVFVDVNDEDLRDDDPFWDESWNDDSVEIYIDIGNDKNPYPPGYGMDDYLYRVEWNTKELEEYYYGRYEGVVWDVYTKNLGQGDGGRGTGYTIEIKFPWETLDVLNTGLTGLGDLVGIEVCVNDQDGAGDRDTQISWYDMTGDAWFDPSVFGTVQLVPSLQAYNPDPFSGKTGVLSGILSWSAGRYAESHDVHFGTNQTPALDEFKGNQPGTQYNAIIGPDTTYYWRIDEVNSTIPPNKWVGYVWDFTTAPLTASNPDPPDGAKYIAYDKDLSWGAGFYANKHNIYFGTAPNPPLIQSNWSTTTYDVGTMVGGVKYYWRINEVNTGGTPIWTGDVWEFTTLAQGAGIMGEYFNNDNLSGIPALIRTDYDINFDWGQGTSDPNIGDDDGDNWSVRWTAELNCPATGDYNFTTVRAPINDGVRLYINGQMIISRWTTKEQPGNEPYEDSTIIQLDAGLVLLVMEFFDTGQAAKAILKWEYPGQPQQVIPRDYFYLPRRSVSPSPAYNEEDKSSTPILNWTPGLYADTHDIYFGTDEDAVTTASRGDKKGVLIRQDLPSVRPVTTYDIADDVNVGLLRFNTTYYWRIDDVNMNIPPNFWSSNVWSFTTDGYHEVENFERYLDPPPIISVWMAEGGATINESTDTLLRQVHAGNESMAYSYNNSTAPFNSEARANTNGPGSLDFGTNWRLQNVKALSLWFHGIPDLRGSFTPGPPTYTLNGDGLGIFSTNYDVFYFLYSEYIQISGRVEARVDSIENTDPCAMAGVMIRDSLNPNSVYGATVVTPDGRVLFMGRGITGGIGSTIATVSGIALPHWVRITRTKVPPFQIIAEHAINVAGAPGPWQPLGANIPWPMAAPIDLGLCITSNSYGNICTAEFFSVAMQCPLGTPVANPVTQADIGNFVLNDPEEMYVVLEDIFGNDGIVYYPGTTNPAQADPCATMIGEWTQWRIDLNDFYDQGVNLMGVDTIYIGFGNRSTPMADGSGMMFFDDIRLYTAQFYEPECPPWPADLERDGSIDYDDLGVIADNWLIEDYNVTPVAPPNDNLVAWYQLEGNTNDFFGIHNGVAVGGPTYTADRREGSSAINLDGIDDYVQTASYAASYGIDGNKPRTITVWAKTREFYNNAGVYEIGMQQNAREFALRTTDELNVWRAQHWGKELGYDIDFTYDSLNKWVHFAHTYDGTTVRIYVDGYLIAERAIPIDTATSGIDTRPFSIGWFGDADGDYYFNGIIDDVRVYNYALSQAQVAYIAGKASQFTQPLELLLTPQNPKINLYVDRPGDPPNIINFKDMAELGNEWGEIQVWPIW